MYRKICYRGGPNPQPLGNARLMIYRLSYSGGCVHLNLMVYLGVYMRTRARDGCQPPKFQER